MDNTNPSSTQLSMIIRFGVLALMLTIVTGAVWTALLIINLQANPTIPWAPAVMAIFLWLLWLYLVGRWPFSKISPARQGHLRARPVTGSVFIWAIAAGGFSIVSLAGFWIVLIQLVSVRGNVLPDYSKYPLSTVILVVGIASLVTSVVEEAGFRGYFQSVLEPKVGGPLAILIMAFVIAPAHGLTQGFAWPTLLFYFLVDAMFGWMAYLTDSILPGLTIHFMGLLIFFSLIWPYDPTRHLISAGGTNIQFWLSIAQTFIFAVLSMMAFRRLVKITRHLPAR